VGELLKKARLDRELAVHRAPTVALLAAGDEVVPPASGWRGSARALLEGSDAEGR
jgi:molybdopterin biosynthesis enzyme